VVNWVDRLVRSKVVKLEKIADVQYGGVAEKCLDLSGDVDLVTGFCVWDEEAEGLMEKISVMSLGGKRDLDIEVLNAETKNKEKTTANPKKKKAEEKTTGDFREKKTGLKKTDEKQKENKTGEKTDKKQKEKMSE